MNKSDGSSGTHRINATAFSVESMISERKVNAMDTQSSSSMLHHPDSSVDNPCGSRGE
jgi:hypothetical protein